MKQLTGTEKQIEYAQSIRKNLVAEIKALGAENTELGKQIIDRLENKVSNAVWWIEQKSLGGAQLANKVGKKIKEEAAK